MRPSIIAGIGVGLATGAWMFGEYALGLHDTPDGAGRWTGFLSLIFPLLGAYWLVVRRRLASWGHVLREGLVFGAVSGVIGAAAIYAYFVVINPGFSVDGRPADAFGQALVGFTGALVIGTVLTLAIHALIGQRRPHDDVG